MYVVKILVCIGILEICTYIGIIMSRQLKNKTKEYENLLSICTYIESRIKYSEDNLIYIFEDVSKQNNNNSFGKLFLDISNEMKKNIYTLNECISRGINNNRYRFSCDFDVLLELTNSLGKTNVENQIKAISLAKSRIDVHIKECKEYENKNIKLYRNLGVICGVMLVIVLI